MDVKPASPFEATTLDDIRAAHQTVRTTYRTNRTKDLAFRKKQIRRLYWGIVDCASLIEDALYKDMGKCSVEANFSELDWCKSECITVANKLDKWARDEPIVDMPLHYAPMRPRIRNEPLGTIFIIGAYNFPFVLNLTPLIGAIAAGNTVVLKPSEHSPRSAMVLKKLFDEYLDPDCYRCVNGGVEQVQCLMDLSFDKIVFTGGRKTGAIIATKAAQSLTPVLLELGGQSPAFITRNADVKLAARRLLFQKCINAGQICLSHNYVLIDRSRVDDFIDALKDQYRVFMPAGAEASPDFSRIINRSHFDRIKAMVDNSKGKVVLGGSSNASTLFIEPTVVLVDDVNDSMMVEESFGPVWALMPFDSLDEAIDVANKVDPTPLALFTFGSDEENEKGMFYSKLHVPLVYGVQEVDWDNKANIPILVLSNVTSGGATVNDSFFHAQFNASPFGGVGASGTGSYHGYYSFRAFSHQRTIAQVPGWLEKILRPRYMPYSMRQLNRYRLLALPSPNFDRDGNVVRGLRYWTGLVLGLGGRSSPGVALRWAVLAALVAAVLGLKRGPVKGW